MFTSKRTAGAVIAVSALATGLGGTVPAQAVTTAQVVTSKPAGTVDPSANKLANKWLAKQLDGGLVKGTYGVDFGLTIDVALALSETGNLPAVKSIRDALAPRVKEYVGDKAAGEVYGGPTAKAAVFARVSQGNPTSFGGLNLVTQLEEQVTNVAVPANPLAGRLFDTSQYGDFANVVGQSYAVRALAVANSPEAAPATDFLLKQQCPSGSFRLNFSPKDAADQSCADGQKGSEADPDATSIAVANLILSGQKGQPVQDAITRGVNWLAAKQLASGAMRGGASTRAINANSTGLAGYAFGLANRTAEARRAAAWVRRLQPVDKFKCRSALTPELGGVAYKMKSVKDARNGGITDEARGEWIRATAQAVPALQWAPAAADKDMRVVPFRKQVRSATRPRFRLFGLAPGEQSCFQTKGDFKRVLGKKTGGTMVRQLRMPSGNSRRWVVLKTGDDVARAWVRVRN
jgi:hypothetical protein